MNRKTLWVLWPVLALAVLARIYSLNPGLINPFSPLLSTPEFQSMTLTIDKREPPGPSTSTWRGNPQRTGTTEGELQFPLKVAWESRRLNYSIHGAAKSSPAVDGDGIFVGGDTGWLYAFNPSGELKWRILFSGAVRGVHGTATMDKDSVYIGAYNGRFYCLNKNDGSPRWIAQLADAIGSSALIDGEFIYVSAETGATQLGNLYKLRRDDGSIVWQSGWTKGQVHSSPTLSEGGKIVFLGSNGFQLSAFDSETGATIWISDMGGEVKGAPAVMGDKVFVASWARELAAVSVRSGEIIWKRSLAGLGGSSPVILPELKMVLANSNRQSLLNAFSLEGNPLWSANLGTRFSYGSAVAVNSSLGTSLLITCGKSNLCAFRARDGKLIQKIALRKGFSSTPAVYGGTVYVSLEDGGLVRLNSASKR